MVIYKISNSINDKIYIGQTTQPVKERWASHKCDARSGKETLLYRAMRKHGVANFKIEVITSTDTFETLNTLEEYYIKKLSCVSPRGYNLLPGGNNHRHHESTKEKIREKLKGRPIANRWNKGNNLPCTKETKQKISDKLKGAPIKHRWGGGNRSPRTAEQKNHLSLLNKGKPNKALQKKVICIETGDEFESVNITATVFKVNRVTISSLIKSGKKGRLGLSFKFKESK